jgi:cysteine desulfurase
VIYLDYNASTPIDSEVSRAVLGAMQQHYANPSNVLSSFGAAARAQLDDARSRLAEALGVAAARVVFTSGATEANNLAIKGVIEARAARTSVLPHVLASAIEHKSVLKPLEQLAKAGKCVVELLPVDAMARVRAADVERVLRPETALVCLMQANNEVGTLQPVEEVAGLCRARGAHVHCDVVQAFGKVAVGSVVQAVDTVAVSAHKLYGPKGAGALVLPEAPKSLLPQIWGGDQEGGYRAGTENVPAIVGFGVAASLVRERQPRLVAQLSQLSQLFLDTLRRHCDEVQVNAAEAARLPGTLSLSIAGIDASSLMESLPQLAISSGSACNSRSKSGSHVLKAMGLSERSIAGSIRISFGLFSTEAEAVEAARLIADQVIRLRRFTSL